MTKKEPLDYNSHIRARTFIDLARRTGKDPVEVLHNMDMLLTTKLRKQIEVEALKSLRAEFLSWMPHEFLRRNRELGDNLNTATPADLYRAISSWFDDMIRDMEER